MRVGRVSNYCPWVKVNMKAQMLKWVILMLECATMHATAQASTCFGKVQQGRLEEGVKLPASGIHFSTYSALGSSLGRTYVHAKVEKIVTGAYATLAQTQASKKYVYGETGLAQGGRFRPHRTHQNGTSADFMVPVLDTNRRSVPLPTSALDKFGYSRTFRS